MQLAKQKNETCHSRVTGKNKKVAVGIAVFVVGVFGFMQAMEIKGATTSQVNLSTTVQSAINVTCTGPAALGSLTPGTPVSATSTCSTTTNANGGYNLQVKRDDATGTLKSGSTYIADKTAWTSSSPNATLWSGTGLGFRVKQTGTTATYNSTWWGSDDTAPNAKYAGLPSAYDTVMSHTSYSAVATDAVVEFKADVPISQLAGAYAGTVTFQAVALP